MPVAPRHAVHALTIMLLAGVPAARAELVEIAWDADGRFARELVLKSGGVAEACGRLAAGQRIAWRFDADRALDFNVHYHEGSKVVEPRRLDAVRSAAETLQVAVDQDHCWMWSNRSAHAARLRVELRR